MRYEVFLTGWDQKIISTFFLIKFQYEFESVHFDKKKINILQNIKWHLKYGGLHIKL